ncbi:MAG TPA: hypothetical protein VF701_01315 [Thermoanaerobaculia bacterium]
MNAEAEAYVRLVLAMGQHDADYVDAYYGPPEWRDETDKERPPLETIRERALALADRLAATPSPSDSLVSLRLSYLRRQIAALIARAGMLRGETLSFDEESLALYDAVAPALSEEHFRSLNASLDEALPGNGSLAERLEVFRRSFVIPPERLDSVFTRAIEICRSKTAERIALPAGETFRVEYVTGKTWSGYNWYQGNFSSLIQVNTDLPIFIDRAIDLAAHEGYPGHHIYNVLLEKNLVRDRGWVEFSVYALFSPQSLIAEGSANYGIDVVVPDKTRLEVEREELFPLAGLDPGKVEPFYRVHDLVAKSAYAGNEAARGYLDGKLDFEGAVEWLTTYALMEPDRARQRVRFIEQYRSYVINYNLGRDLVRNYVERLCGGDEVARWRVFTELLSSPRLPSALV